MFAHATALAVLGVFAIANIGSVQASPLGLKDRDSAPTFKCIDDNTFVESWQVGSAASSATFSMAPGTNCYSAYPDQGAPTDHAQAQQTAAPTTAHGDASLTHSDASESASNWYASASFAITPSGATSSHAAAAATTATSSREAIQSYVSSSSGASPSASGSLSTSGGSKNAAPTSTGTGAMAKAKKRNVAYFDVYDFPLSQGQTFGTSKVPAHDILSQEEYFKSVTHLVIAWLDITSLPKLSDIVATSFDHVTDAQLQALKTKYGFQIMYSLGGWGMSKPLETVDAGALADSMVDYIKAHPFVDGFDLDQEYPKKGSEKLFVDILGQARAKLDAAFGEGTKTLSVAVPALQRDIDANAYDKDTLAKVDKSVQFWNLMTYDEVNRFDTKTGYHASLPGAKQAISSYEALGISKDRMNVGFPMYAKGFTVTGDCPAPHTGCQMPVLQNGDVDNGKSVALRFYEYNNFKPTTMIDPPMSDATWKMFTDSFAASQKATGTYVTDAKTDVWFDTTNSLFWTWMSPQAMQETCEAIADDGKTMMA